VNDYYLDFRQEYFNTTKFKQYRLFLVFADRYIDT